MQTEKARCNFATDDPRGFLAGFPDGAVLDEIQRAPELASYLQEIVDKDGRDGLFILTGSQQFAVIDTVNQTLAGRTALLRLLPFSIEEIASRFPVPSLHRLLYQRFYPRPWLLTHAGDHLDHWGVDVGGDPLSNIFRLCRNLFEISRKVSCIAKTVRISPPCQGEPSARGRSAA